MPNDYCEKISPPPTNPSSLPLGLYADEMEEQAMTNNQLCNLLGAVGCTLTATCMFLMFFGATGAAWGAAAGIIIGAISLFSYD